MLPIMIALTIGIGLLVLPELVFAKEYVVGDENGWNYEVDYYAWADGKTFYVGDLLVFNYAKEEHNVIVVNATGYDTCLASPNLGAFDSGNDKISLTPPGKKYYICQWHCDYSDQKLMITVLRKKMLGTPISSPH
uniref:Phytocyanin domain-containing protein n=2 Tax=Quercus lobata TaxID=97700 RepID=A0A7N2LIJ3_QUELO